MIVSEFNKLEGNRYFDVESQTSFEVDHVSQEASDPQSYVLESQNGDLMYVLSSTGRKTPSAMSRGGAN